MDRLRKGHGLIFAVCVTMLGLGVASADPVALRLAVRSQTTQQNAEGAVAWRVNEYPVSWAAHKTALVVVDAWDQHPEGTPALSAVQVDRINATAAAARTMGSLVVHAPSGAMKAYQDHPGRVLAQSAPVAPVAEAADRTNPPFPIEDVLVANGMPGLRQVSAIEIQPGDIVTDSVRELHNNLAQRGIRHVLIAGAYTNYYGLDRSIGVKPLVRLGYDVALLRDLTVTYSDPMSPPYVNAEESHRLVLEYVEKFWCPTIASDDIVVSLYASNLSIPSAVSSSTSLEVGQTQWDSLLNGGPLVRGTHERVAAQQPAPPMQESWAWKSKFAPYSVLDPASQL